MIKHIGYGPTIARNDEGLSEKIGMATKNSNFHSKDECHDAFNHEILVLYFRTHIP